MRPGRAKICLRGPVFPQTSRRLAHHGVAKLVLHDQMGLGCVSAWSTTARATFSSRGNESLPSGFGYCDGLRARVVDFSRGRAIDEEGPGFLTLHHIKSAPPVWKSKFRRVRAESPRRPPRHLRDACSMAWRCRSRRSQRRRETVDFCTEEHRIRDAAEQAPFFKGWLNIPHFIELVVDPRTLKASW